MKNMVTRYICLLLFFLVGNLIHAEGTRQLRPQVGDRGGIQIQARNGSGATFAYFNGDENQRLNVRICNVGEQIHLGFSYKQNLRFRLLAPNGTVVIPLTTLNFNAANSPGRINSHAQAVAGPNIINGSGYVPLSHTTTMTGDYYIEFQNTNNGDPTITEFDATVTRNGQTQIGRLWSKAWMINTAGFDNPFNGVMYIYTKDQVVTRVDFNGIQPYEFIISANNTGTANTGNLLQDRRSIPANRTYPEYQIFLNDPDINCFPTGFLGEFIGATITGCPGDYCINVEVTAPGTMAFYIEANGTPGHQQGTSDRIVNEFVNTGKNCVKWDGLDGLGNPIGNNVSVNIGISYSNGLTHLPLFDVENHTNGYNVTYVRPVPVNSPPNIRLYWDDSNIIEGVALDGITSFGGCLNTTGCHRWENRGAIFTNNTCQIECPQTINTWWFVKESTSEVIYNRSDKDVDANRNKPGKGSNNDTLVCAADLSLPINGLVTGDRGVKWTLLRGMGTIANDTMASTVYNFNPNDKNGNNVIFLISSRGDACPPVYDTMKVTFDPIKSMVLNAPEQICATNPTISITSTLTNATNINWNTGDGSFSPNRNSRNFTYTPTSSEITNGLVKLIANTTDAIVACPNTKDSIEVKLSLPPTVVAPPDTNICLTAHNPRLNLKAQYSNADSLHWYASNPSIFVFDNPVGDSVAGTITTNTSMTIRVDAYRDGCPTASDVLEVGYFNPPSLSASAVPTCDLDQKFLLSGNINNAFSNDIIAWSRNGNLGVLNQDSTVLTNAYIPSISDIDSGYVSLTLKHVVVDNCPAKDTTLRLRIIPFPTADAGKDSLLCRGSQLIQKTNINTDWSYVWTSTLNGAPISTNDSVLLTLNNDTDLYLEVSNSLGCKANDNARFTVLDPPNITLPPHICFYGDTQINATVTNKPSLGKYSWNKDGSSLNDTTETLLITAAGNYVYSYTFNQCVSSAVLKATLPPSVLVPDLLACENTTGTLSADSVYKAIYSWDNGAHIGSSPTYSIIATPGAKEVNLTVTDSLGCQNTTKANVEGVPVPTFNLAAQDVCEGISGKIQVTLDDPTIENRYALGYLWEANSTAISSGSWKELSFNKSGLYNLKLNIGNCKLERSIPVNVFPNPVIDITKQHKYCFENAEPIILKPNNTFAKYRWYGKDGFINTNESLPVSPREKSYYGLAVENNYGCKDSIPIVVNVACPPRLFVPNIITPNTNNQNSYLNIFGAFYKDFELTIFSRWGEIIYNTRDPKDVWDGTYKGEEMPIGVYPWIVTYDAEYEEYKGNYKQKGDVTVVR